MSRKSIQPRDRRLMRYGVAAAAAALAALPAAAAAQTDYFNTDAGRPIRIEDAAPLERYGFEVQLAPLRLERAGGVYHWGVEPEVAYGILPRTYVEVGVPLAHVDAGPGRRRTGLAGIDVAVLHNLNLETSIPALAVRADVLLPVGNLGPSRAYPSLTGIVTRTIPGLGATRVHANAQYTFGRAPAPNGARTLGAGAVELSRWLGGVALDRTFPLSSTLVAAELYASRPIHADEPLEWNAGAGVRHQFTPRLALDLGGGRRLTGGAPGWYATFGTAVAFGAPGLVFGRR